MLAEAVHGEVGVGEEGEEEREDEGKHGRVRCETCVLNLKGGFSVIFFFFFL